MKKGKFLSSLAAAALSVSMLFAPVASSFASQTGDAPTAVVQPTGTLKSDQLSETKPTSTTLTIHKLQAKGYKAGAPWNHTGGEITNPESLGTEVKGLDGVQFTVYKLSDNADLEKMLENRNSYKNASDLKNLPDINGGTTATATKLADGEQPEKTENGGEASVNLKDGKYWVLETDKPKDVTGAIAVPFGISIPVMNIKDVTSGDKTIKANTQYLKTVHVYPKNTTGTPKIDKNFDKSHKYTEVDKQRADGKTGKADESVTGNGTNVNDGADYGNYQKEKARVAAKLGSEIPYDVKTQIPQSSNYKNLTWSDNMTDGLTFLPESLKFGTIDGNGNIDETAFTVNVDYTVEADGRGFNLKFTQAGLEKLADLAKDKDVDLGLKYDAKVNGDAVVDNPEKNDIKLHYGNNPEFDKESPEVTPNNNEITVNKSWTGGEPTAEANVVVEYVLVDTSDNSVVDSEVKNSSTGYDHTFKGLDNNKKYKVYENVIGYNAEYATTTNGQLTVTNSKPPKTTPKDNKINVTKSWTDGEPNAAADVKIVYTLVKVNDDNTEEVIKSVTRTSKTGYDYTFENLEEGANYYVKERVAGYNPKYATTENGKITVTNTTNNDNPTPLNPTEPEVVYGGKRFVKTGETEDVRLGGAEFVVKKGNQYISLKSNDQIVKDNQAVEAARKELNVAIDVYNNLTADKQTKEERAKVDAAQEKYNNAVKAAGDKYDLTSNIDEAYKLVSDNQGKFEIAGLEYAEDYALEEVKAPEGYAKHENDIPFTVENGSYAGADKELQYNPLDEQSPKGLRVVNKNLTIPQTGGIGSLIFIVAGLALMGVAFVAMKRRNSYEEA